MTEQRQRILDEIYATEKSYVESMGYCIEYFYKTLNSDKNPTQMTKEEVQNLFQHYDQILNINKGFKEAMDDLRQKNLMGDQIGKLFTQYIPFFKVYIPFVSHYDRVNMIMDKYEREEGFYETMMKIMETIPTNNPLDLRSYLIMPVQRLPRYELLVKDLLKHTEETHPDYINLQTAYEKIKETTMMVNERSKEFEQRNNVLKVNDYITGFHDFELIQPDRALILEGELIKVCKKANKPRYFYLFNDMIVYGIGFQKITVSEYFFLKSVQLTEDIRYEHSFAIYNDIKSFTVICKDAREKEKWFNEIKKHVEIQKKLSTTKEENSRPVWVPDKDALNCLTCGKQFTKINRRHHCRKCGRCICGDCSKGKMVLKDGGEPERVCIYCFDATKSTADLQKQTIKKMQNCDKNEDLFNTLNCNASMAQTGKTKRQRKKSNAELGERKTFAELMNGSNEETKKASQSMMFDFVHDEDIHLKSSYGKTQLEETSKLQTNNIYDAIGTNSINNTNDISNIIGSNNITSGNDTNTINNTNNMNGTEQRKVQTLGDMQTHQTTVSPTPRNAFVEMSESMKRKERPQTQQYNMSIMFDTNTNVNNNSNGNTPIDGGLESGRKSPRQRPRIGDRRTQRMQTIDFSDLQNESIQPNKRLEDNEKQRIGVQHTIPIQNTQTNQTSKTKELDHEKKKELMLEGLETLSREYHQSKTPRSTTKNSSPALVDQKRSQSAQIASPLNSSPSPNAMNSSFDKPFDFSSTNNFKSITKYPKSSTSSPRIDIKRNSIPESFDFSTQNNLFDSKHPSTPSNTKDAATVNMMPPQTNTSNQFNQQNQVNQLNQENKKSRTRQFQKRSNTTVNEPTFRQNQTQQISMMYDFTSDNNFNQQNQSFQSPQMQQTTQFNQTNDLFDFSNSQPQTHLQTPKDQQKKLGITIENGDQTPSFTRKQPTSYQTQTLGRKQFLSQQGSDKTLNILMSPGNQPSQINQMQQTSQMNQMSTLDQLLNPNVPMNQLNQNTQNNPLRQNYQMQPMQISIDQSNGEEQKTTHKRRSMSREGKRKRSKSRDKDEQSENMKKLTEMYDESQKEHQISLQHAQVFNLSNSFFASSGTPTKGINNSFSNSANNSPALHPFFNTLQTENKMSLSKKDRHTLIFNNTDEIMTEGANISNTNGMKESKVCKNRRIYEQKIKKQKEEEKRDFMLRSSIILSELK